MQTHDMEFELTSSALNTPSILQPNIALTATPFTSASNHFYGDHDTASTPDLPSMTTSASNSDPPSSSSTDAKVSIIEDQLKQGFSESRKPTPSPFQQFITANSTGFPLEKVSSVAIKDEDMPIQIPSTADVRLALVLSFLCSHDSRSCLDRHSVRMHDQPANTEAAIETARTRDE